MRKAAERLRPLDTLTHFTIGDITVTPLPADHSAWDALMFLIEAEGKRILHTGDFRLHGFRGKIRYNCYVFALCASTNIDRLASLHNATPRGRYFLCDRYQKDILETVREGAKSPYYQFQKVLTYGKNLEPKMWDCGFVMAVRAGNFFTQVVGQYPEAILIYSMWTGYLDGRNPALSEFVRPFVETGRIRYLHASGHATAQALKQVCDTVQPRLGILPIHSEQPERFRSLGLQFPVIALVDGELLSL